jgi:hypothetical protein
MKKIKKGEECECKDEHFKIKRNMDKNNYCAKWSKTDKPWCYTKNNCGEKGGGGGSYKYCKESKSCTNSSECGYDTYCHSDLPGCLSKFKNNKKDKSNNNIGWSYNNINSDNGTPCNEGSYCKPKLEDAEQCHFDLQCGKNKYNVHGRCSLHLSKKKKDYKYYNLCNDKYSSKHPQKFDRYE